MLDIIQHEILLRLERDSFNSALPLSAIVPNRARATVAAWTAAMRDLRSNGYVELRRDDRWETTIKGAQYVRDFRRQRAEGGR